ncbi:MAG TPA: hypothetical protein VKD19_05815, partial [Pseudolabrys sp.]|nr:hypothetical protein [Pseudolabrys sp.]
DKRFDNLDCHRALLCETQLPKCILVALSGETQVTTLATEILFPHGRATGGRGSAISVLMSTKAEYRERQRAVPKSNRFSNLADSRPFPLDRTSVLGICAYAPEADILRVGWQVRFVPIADMGPIADTGQ